MLEKRGIDFVVLEAYPEIAPQVGASIALLPNGFRIIDQLGCYEDILKNGQYPVDDFQIHDLHGKRLVGLDDLRKNTVGRFGYPMLFFDRRALIEILYNHIQRKDKVLTSKRVKSVEEHADKVTVTTEDGSIFEGDLAIGADGMHSTVRQQIERQTSGTCKLRTDTLPADYGAIFGISRGPSKVEKGSVTIATNKGSSCFIASGPDDKTYFALFVGLGKTYYGDNVPCRGKIDEARIVKDHLNDAVTETCKFSDIYNDAVVSVCTPLHEYVIENWHTQRCMLIGDSVHKFNPIAGQGGNTAIETAAALTNALAKALKAHSPEKIPQEVLHSLLKDVQELRKPRATHILKLSDMMQAVYAEENRVLTAMNRYILPFFGSSLMLGRFGKSFPAAVSLDTLEIPARPRTIPYVDELLRTPSPRSKLSTVFVSTVLIGLSALASYLLLGVGEINGTFALVERAAQTGFVPELGVSLHSAFEAARFPALDKLCKTLVAVFLPVVSGAEGLASKIQAGYFLVGVYLPLLSIIAIEGYRRGNIWTLMWSPSLWTGLAQLLGLGVVLPLFVLANFYHSRGRSYWTAANQAVPDKTLNALLLSLLVGYLVPSILLVTLDGQSALLQDAIAFWQTTPILVIGLTELLSRPLHPPPPRPPREKPNTRAEVHQPPNLTALKRFHTTTFLLSATAHLSTLAYTALHPSPSLLATFIPQHHPAAPVATAAQGMAAFFQLDLLLTLAAALVWSLVTVADLRRAGLACERPAAVVALLAAGWVVVGPGAATAALWRWREVTVAGFRPGALRRAEWGAA
ncbi:fad binding domain protein [Neofusicoccum parvum]|nr:fad binding domain protein [Neofusicoccum parvum]